MYPSEEIAHLRQAIDTNGLARAKEFMTRNGADLSVSTKLPGPQERPDDNAKTIQRLRASKQPIR